MLKFRKAKLLILFLLLFLFLGASFILAQKPLEVTYPQIPGVTTPATTKTALPDYIRYIFQFSLFLGAIIAFSSFIYGGVRYLTSAGSPSAQKDAKSQISAGVLGLIILVSAYLILNTINPQLVALKVSLPGRAPGALPAAGPPKPGPATYLEIPIGGLIENLWGTSNEPKKANCYDYEDNIDDPPFLTDYDRLKCIRKLSYAIRKKAENLKEPIEELRKLYDCQNCCRDCCKNVCNWTECSEICGLNEETGLWEYCPLGNLCCEGTQNKGCWESCGAYQCCEEKGMVHQYYYQECPYGCCEYFEACRCENCEGCICVKEDEDGKPICCNPDNPIEHWEDPTVEDLIEQIKLALKELRLKLGLFPLTEELKDNKKICCPGDACPPDSETGAMDCLLKDSKTKDLIIKILIGDPSEEEFIINEEKLKEILKIKSVITYLIENDWLSTDKNLAKIMMRNLDLLKSEVGLNEIAWMGTQADSNDEWIELYNNTKENIDLTGWKLVVKDKFEIELSGIIPAQGFYLLENNENAISDIEADLIYSGNLVDSGEIIETYDEFGNLVEELDCSSEWFGGDDDLKASMERIDSKGCLNAENWTTNLSVRVEEEERKKEYINGEDKDENPIYGTPKNLNSAGVGITSYPPFNSLVGELREKLRNEKSAREKLILVLRNDDNLEKMLKTKEALKDILVGEDWRLKNLLNHGEVLQVLLEDEENLNLLLANDYIKELIKDILIRTGGWKEEEGGEEQQEWADLMDSLDEARTNLKLINDFQRDLLWVLNARDLMRGGCEEDPISYDQLRGVPEEFIFDMETEKVPEWKDIEPEIPWIEGTDPATFYCHKPLW